MPNTDAKVFEVVIQLNESDSILRPSMTTSNDVDVSNYTDVLYLPIEAVYSFDNMKAVYVDGLGGLSIKEVSTGESNDNFIIINSGVSEGEEVLIIPRSEGVSDTIKLEAAI
jgi:multidrug efflux pump subunit AcrA (membrane-fusion protein)